MRNCAVILAATIGAAASFGAPSAATARSAVSVALPPTSATCVFKKSDYVTATAEESTTSVTYVNLNAGGLLSFNTAKSGCVAGTLSAIAGNVTVGDSMRMQILLDGSTCDPFVSNLSFAQSGVDFSQHSISFLCGGNVPAGSHKIQVQYHSGSGGKAAFEQRVLEVKHR